MKFLKSIFSSPYFLSLIPFIILLLLVQDGFKRYTLKVENTEILPENTNYLV